MIVIQQHIPTSTPFQAWRAGFREGVKMCLNKGSRPTLQDFKDRVHHRNLDHLTVWQNVGRDVENGIWAMLGARMGTYMTMITPEWDYRQVQNFDALQDLYASIDGHDPEIIAARIAEDLSTQLDLPITMMYDNESKFFKHHYRSNWHNQGVMIRELDVIRRPRRLVMTKSVFLTAAEQMKEDLGPALCLAKWKQVSSTLAYRTQQLLLPPATARDTQGTTRRQSVGTT
jgi:hypothetical protein